MLEWRVTVAEPVVLTGEEVRLHSVIKNTAVPSASAQENGLESGSEQAGEHQHQHQQQHQQQGAWGSEAANEDRGGQHHDPNVARMVSGYRPVHFARTDGPHDSERALAIRDADSSQNQAEGGGVKREGRGPATLTANGGSALQAAHGSGSPAGEQNLPTSPKRRHAQPHAKGTESIACAIIQVVCQMAGNPSRVDMHKQQSPATSYSFTPAAEAKGSVVYASVPVILFCDLHLAPGETRRDDVRVKIAPDAPPTYKGQAVSYIYRVVGGLQRFDEPTRYAHLPIKVHPVVERVHRQSARGSATSLPLDDALSQQEEDADDQQRKSPDKTSNSPFDPRAVRTEGRDHILRAIATLTRRRAPCVYRLRNSKGLTIAAVSLPKQAFRLGETIDLTLSFEESDVTVAQVDVKLLSREVLQPAYRLARITEDVATSDTTHAAASFRTGVSVLETVGLPIPLVSHTNFDTDTVSVRWTIAVDMTYLHPPNPSSTNAGDTASTAAAPVADHVRWTTSLDVFPANPITIPFKSVPLLLES